LRDSSEEIIPVVVKGRLEGPDSVVGQIPSGLAERLDAGITLQLIDRPQWFLVVPDVGAAREIVSHVGEVVMRNAVCGSHSVEHWIGASRSKGDC
jgi:hypothetical protein